MYVENEIKNKYTLTQKLLQEKGKINNKPKMFHTNTDLLHPNIMLNKNRSFIHSSLRSQNMEGFNFIDNTTKSVPNEIMKFENDETADIKNRSKSKENIPQEILEDNKKSKYQEIKEINSKEFEKVESNLDRIKGKIDKMLL